MAGCTTGSGFHGFECSLRTLSRDGDGGWRLEERAIDRGVVGPGYLRIERESAGGGPALGRIWDEAQGAYWEYQVEAGVRSQWRMWPLGEVRWRMMEEMLEARRNVRASLAREPPLRRHELWRLFSGGLRELRVLSDQEQVHGAPAHKVRVALTPGASWDVWVSQAFPVSPAGMANLLTVLGVPGAPARQLVARLDGVPVEFESIQVDSARRMIYSFTRLPWGVAAESAASVVPSDVRNAFAVREARYADARVLLQIADRAQDPPEGMTRLGACVRLGGLLSPRDAPAVIRRLQTVPEPAARRCLMYVAARALPGHVSAPLAHLAANAPIPVARDAAETLLRVSQDDTGIQCVLAVLRRGWRAGHEREVFHWAADLLRVETGLDLGFWPGRDEEAAILRWLDTFPAPGGAHAAR